MLPDEVILSIKNHLKKLSHLNRPPETALSELRLLSTLMTSLVAQLVQPKLIFFFKVYPNQILQLYAWKKFKNFFFQIRTSVQFLFWKRRFHGLVMWFFKSLTLCFCLNYNQKVALVYLSKGVSFLSPGTDGLSKYSFGSGNMLKKSLCRV